MSTEGGNEGGAASVFGGGAPDAGGGNEGQGGAPAQGAGNEGAAGNAGGDPGAQGGAIWYDGLSDASADADTLSDRAWMDNKKYADLPTMVKAMRGLEKKVGSRFEMPGEGATAEQIAEFHKALGRPDEPTGYQFKLPEGVQGAFDDAVIGSFAEAAHKAGLPPAMAQPLVDWYVAQQLDADVQLVAARDKEANDLIAEWGPNADANKALGNRAMQALNLSARDVADIQKGLGARKTMELLVKLGAGMAEDMMGGMTGGRRNFGITAEQARVELDAMNSNPETVKKIMEGDKTLLARRQRMIEAIADADERKARAA